MPAHSSAAPAPMGSRSAAETSVRMRGQMSSTVLAMTDQLEQRLESADNERATSLTARVYSHFIPVPPAGGHHHNLLGAHVLTKELSRACRHFWVWPFSEVWNRSSQVCC